MHRTAPTTKNHLTGNVSAEVEKPLFILITNVRVILFLKIKLNVGSSLLKTLNFSMSLK